MAIESTGRGRTLGRLRAMMVLALLCSLGSFVGVARAGGYAAIVVDGTSGQVLQQVNADERDYPASLTKMMTLYLTFQGLKSGKLRLDQPMPVSAWAAGKSPTKLGLRAGQTVSVQDCVLGMITKSANDAATVMAEGIGGSESHFAEMMTEKGRQLGMRETNYHNASGLPDPLQITTATDLSVLARHLAYDFPQYFPYFALTGFNYKGSWYPTHDNLIGRYQGADGIKTGYTGASGFNLVSSVTRGNMHVIGIVMGGRTAIRRDLERSGLPKLGAGEEVVIHPGHMLVYSEKHEQAKWVAHIAAQDLVTGNLARIDSFLPDPLVRTGTAVTADYWNSGYDRGHLVPSADMRWNAGALQATYYYSNISPQLPELNRGTWAELEVHDMVGNLDEWVDDPEGTFVGGFYARARKDGCAATVRSHGFDYADYSTGFRCCADPELTALE